MNEERATDKQIAAITKAKLHEQPWTLSKREAWKLMDDKFGKGVPPTPPTYQGTESAEAEVVNMTATASSDTKPKREFHLSEEQVRTNALEASLKIIGVEKIPTDTDIDRILNLAKKFEEYLWNGKEQEL